MDLSVDAVAAYAAVADALLPSVDGPVRAWTGSATELGVAGRLDEVWDLLPSDAHRAELRRLLGLLASRAGGLALYGKPRPFEL